MSSVLGLSRKSMDNISDKSPPLLVERGIARSWSIRVIGLLLLVQAIGLVSISLSKSIRINWQQALRGEALSAQAMEAVVISGMFLPLAILAVVAALSILWVSRIGWLFAMIVQAVTLLVCLTLYFQHKPIFIYPLMLSCIILILYLNSFDVHLAFHVRSPSMLSEAEDEY
jgi:hypothetical protein